VLVRLAAGTAVTAPPRAATRSRAASLDA